MFEQKKYIIATILLLSVFTFTAPDAHAGGKEYEKVVKHLKTKYQAKKVKIPMVWLARFAVRMIRPAGVKSFSITTFEDLKFTPETLDREMQTALRNSFGAEWSPIFRVRSRKGEQAYMYMREAGDSIKLMMVTIQDKQATVIRAAFSPEKLVNFMNEPKIFGISLDSNEAKNKPPDNDKDIDPEDKKEKTEKN